MSTILFLNNYQTTLGAALSSTATTMTVSSTTGLPSSLASGQFIPMTLTPASSPGSAYEIVYVTGISGSTLTVERGQEGTSALNWNTGDILYSTNTAETTGTSTGSPTVAFQTDALTASGLITANGGVTVPSGETLTVDGNTAVDTLTASGLITANDGIDVAGGTLTVPNATASNQAVAFGQFVTSFGGSGYIKLPGGFILQWGTLTISSGASATFTYPITFPTSFMSGWVSVNSTTGGNASLGGLGNSNCTVYNGSAGSANIFVFVIGY